MLNFILDPTIQATLSWIGSGLTVLAIGAWTVFKFFRKSNDKEVDNPIVKADKGIAALGNVKVDGDFNVREGVPHWIFGIGLIGLLLLAFRLVFSPQPLSSEEIKIGVTGSFLKIEMSDNQKALVELQDSGSASVKTVWPGNSRIGNGSWNTNERNEVCLSLPLAPKHQSSGLCLPSVRKGNEVQLETDGFVGIQWINPHFSREDFAIKVLEGSWIAFGYQCPFGVIRNEVVTIRALSESSLVAVKDVGDPCVPAGFTTWTGDLEGDTLNIIWTVGTSLSPASGTAPGAIRIITENLLLSDGASGERILFQRSK